MCCIIVGLQGHCFHVPAPVMRELDNFGVDCNLCGDAIGHMGGVTVSRGPDPKYLVTWRRISSAEHCDLHWWEHASQWVARDMVSVAVVSSDCETDSLRVADSDFVAVFNGSRWTVSWQ